MRNPLTTFFFWILFIQIVFFSYSIHPDDKNKAKPATITPQNKLSGACHRSAGVKARIDASAGVYEVQDLVSVQALICQMDLTVSLRYWCKEAYASFLRFRKDCAN